MEDEFLGCQWSLRVHRRCGRDFRTRSRGCGSGGAREEVLKAGQGEFWRAEGARERREGGRRHDVRQDTLGVVESALADVVGRSDESEGSVLPEVPEDAKRPDAALDVAEVGEGDVVRPAVEDPAEAPDDDSGVLLGGVAHGDVYDACFTRLGKMSLCVLTDMT